MRIRTVIESDVFSLEQGTENDVGIRVRRKAENEAILGVRVYLSG